MGTVIFKTRSGLQKSALRQANERLVLDAIRRNPAISRSDLARMTGLSPSSISFIVNRLMRSKMVLEQPAEARAHVGRRATALRLGTDTMAAVAVEIRPGDSRVALVDLAGSIVRERCVEWNDNCEILLLKINAAIRSLLDRAGSYRVLGAGVSLPGSIDRASTRLIAAVNLRWFNLDTARYLQAGLSLPLCYENDANLCALAEDWFADGREKPPKDFVYLLCDEGLGTGIVVNGQLLEGATIAGSGFGHTILYQDGRDCPCGKRGCWEQYGSARALRRVYEEMAGRPPAPGGETVETLAQKGDAAALRALNQVARDIGLGLLNVIAVLAPEAIVLGGFLSGAWDLVERPVWELVRGHAPKHALSRLRILPSRHGRSSVLLGAAALVFSHFFTTFDEGTTRPGSVMMQTAQ